VAREGQHIFDVGCGFGGDLQKWHKCGVNINMCDPEPSALEEARSRAKNMHMRVNFYEGDIHNCPNRKFDIVCFNFSLHYIFASKGLFMSSIKEIKKACQTRWTSHRYYSRFRKDHLSEHRTWMIPETFSR
jgi:ubiquinone/menaquinone biosynthesis C-methylase UbiE